MNKQDKTERDSQIQRMNRWLSEGKRGECKIGKGEREAQTSSCEINKSQGCNV